MTRVADLAATQHAQGIHPPGAGFLGAIAKADEHGVQLLDIDRILPLELDALLFRSEPERAGVE